MRALVENGHQVHLVVATKGEAGLADLSGSELGKIRIQELQEVSELIGVDNLFWLGYADSGLEGNKRGSRETFVAADLELAAERLADFCRSVTADVLVGYDKQGGYGHPDHLKVHQVASRAAEILDIDIFLEATVSQNAIRRIVTPLSPLAYILRQPEALKIREAFSPDSEIGITVDISKFTKVKRLSLEKHASQHSGGEQLRTLKAFSALPQFVFDLLFRKEWFVVRWEKSNSNPLRNLGKSKELSSQKR
ncbi:MAG: hypothetical protein RL038_822 [Actinomycetota bacterium]